MRSWMLGWLAALPLMSQTVDFPRDVEPLLKSRCLMCHNAQVSQNGVRFDDGTAALAGGVSGPVIVPGKSGESKLILRVTSTKKGFAMPPMGAPLTPAEVATLRAWIDQGAKWPAKAGATKIAAKPASTLWSLQPLMKPEPPAVKDEAWAKNAIDRFVLSRLEKEKIAPSAEATKATLLRRVSLDLTGLPPAPEEVEAFLADPRPDAYERQVERLLASPHYGERWARFWLDLARYADSDGYEKDQVRPIAWRYRSYVIDAFNRDLPFDQFTTEQLAGDLLSKPTAEQRVATGFQRNTLTNREAGVDRAEARFEQVVNRASTVGTVWLGLTVGCAQCHNHKFDPITQKDFYSMYAFFHKAKDVEVDAPLPGEMGPYLRSRPEYEKRREELFAVYDARPLQKEWEERMRYTLDHSGENLEWDFMMTSFKAMVDNAERVLRTPDEKRRPYESEALTYYFLYNTGPAQGRDAEKLACLKDLRRRLENLDAKTPNLTRAMGMEEDDQAPPAHIAVRGDYREKGIEVAPDALSALPPLPKDAPHNRLGLARWLVSRENPLTARVTANRFWQELFGRGLVRTSEDFGTQGEKPTHPELLDWLASEFMDNDWSVKRLLRTVVTSATYRQSSNARKDLAERDPDNALLARQSRLRLTAEQIRDAALQSSGLLNTAIGGPSVRPPQPAGLDALGYAGSVKWRESEGAERYRRGLYIFFQRTVPYPQLMTFDAPDSTVSCSRRRRSNSPLQALNMLNDPVFYEAAQALAERLAREEPGDARARVERAFLVTLGRRPSAPESERILKYAGEQQSAWVGVSRVMLNLDEFITRE